MFPVWVAARDASPFFSWKRALKLLVCLLSVLWLLLGHVLIPFEGGFPAPLPLLVRNSVLDLAAMLTILLSVPRRWKYVLGPIFLLLAIWIVWNLWDLRSLPWDRTEFRGRATFFGMVLCVP